MGSKSITKGCYNLHPQSSYSFYHLRVGGKLRRLEHYSKGVQPVSKPVFCSGRRDRHNCLECDLNILQNP